MCGFFQKRVTEEGANGEGGVCFCSGVGCVCCWGRSLGCSQQLLRFERCHPQGCGCVPVSLLQASLLGQLTLWHTVDTVSSLPGTPLNTCLEITFITKCNPDILCPCIYLHQSRSAILLCHTTPLVASGQLAAHTHAGGLTNMRPLLPSTAAKKHNAQLHMQQHITAR